MYSLQTERTLLSLLVEEDLPDMEAMARETDTFKYLKKFQTMTSDEYTQFLQTKLEQIRNGIGYHWAVRLKTDQHFIGAVNLNPIKGTSKLQIGCQLKRDFWSQGFASELMARLLEFAIRDLKLTAVYGVFEKENKASRKLLEKLGFVFEEGLQEQEVELEIHKYTVPGSHTA
ncbi:GNAT family N-acetyltransferase [Flavitalea sp. BT771]|uniref:GNAT family N-acetyltransferase n=1 Tax=Flavitalea sp. BT771 TaxID=3063329 RepID=UPI0026E44555|nr:GNAT family N-acetyltransferase [Flavitalea sp. BT771]MDO6433834.1 GNAT family N-acetyltransferase [Flavitalea sp. BT771]MDV6222261.1 GNAT family N-acetyltransferase [Flavitalea sp. BT771]